MAPSGEPCEFLMINTPPPDTTGFSVLVDLRSGRHNKILEVAI